MAAKILRASNAQQLIACPGSANLELAIPGWQEPVEDPTKYTAKGLGTKLHEVLASLVQESSHEPPLHQQQSMLYGDCITLEWFAACKKRLREQIILFGTRNGEPSGPRLEPRHAAAIRLLEDVAPRHIRFLVDALQQVRRMLVPGTQLYVESKFESHRWLPGTKGCTPDLILWTPLHGTLRVVDYKTGSIEVSAADNAQLMFYAKTFITELQLNPKKIERIHLHIIQPKNFVSHQITVDELEEWVQTAQNTQQQIEAGSTKLVPGDHCTFCPANPYARGERGYPACPAQRAVLFPDVIDIDDVLN